MHGEDDDETTGDSNSCSSNTDAGMPGIAVQCIHTLQIVSA